MNNFIAVIPARGGSKGLPNKNILEFNGIPLIAWSILFAQATNKFSRIIVSTDSSDIAKVASEYNASVPFIRHPNLASDTSTTSDVVLDVIDRCNLDDSDVLVLLEPTSPYRTLEDFEHLVSIVDEQGAPKVISVSEAVSTSFAFQYFLGGDGETPLLSVQNGNLFSTPRRQDVSPTYYLDGTFYASKIDAFRRSMSFLDASTVPLIVTQLSSLEIDNLTDFLIYNSIFSCLGPPSWYKS